MLIVLFEINFLIQLVINVFILSVVFH